MTTAVVPKKKPRYNLLDNVRRKKQSGSRFGLRLRVEVEEVEEEDHHGTVIQELDDEEPEEPDSIMGERGNVVDEVLSQFCNEKS